MTRLENVFEVNFSIVCLNRFLRYLFQSQKLPRISVDSCNKQATAEMRISVVNGDTECGMDTFFPLAPITHRCWCWCWCWCWVTMTQWNYSATHITAAEDWCQVLDLSNVAALRGLSVLTGSFKNLCLPNRRLNSNVKALLGALQGPSPWLWKIREPSFALKL